jgi:hypothetical protein
MRWLLCHSNGGHDSWRAAVTQHYAVADEEKPHLQLERCSQSFYAHVQSYDLIKAC